MVTPQRFWWNVSGLVILCCAPLGCAHHAKQVREVRAAYLNGDLPRAEVLLDELTERPDAAQNVLLADHAIVALVTGDVRRAEAMLRRARDGFDSVQQRDLREEALSLLADDRQRAYPGEDYEQVLIRSFLAIANLMSGGDDAIAYCLQANRKQQQIISDGFRQLSDNPKLDYKRVALSSYLYGIIREASHRNYDDALRAYQQVALWAPQFASIQRDVMRVQTASHSPPGYGVVYVIALVGPGPSKREVTAPVTSHALAIASQLLAALGDRQIPAMSAPVKVPQIVVTGTNVDAVRVAASGRDVGVSETVTDVNQLAIAQWQATRDVVIGRAVARRIAKKAAVYKVKSELKSQEGWTDLAWDAAEFLWSASESADTRCWSLLPGQIQMLRCELPVGRHELMLQPLTGGQISGDQYTCPVQIVDGRNTYVLACFPNARLAGNIVVSTGTGATHADSLRPLLPLQP